MSGTFLSGPSVVAGPMLGNLSNNFPQEYGAEFGPSIGYQGDAIPDVRFSPINKDNPLPGSIPAHLNSPYFLQVDAIPSAAATNNIATAAANASVTSGTKMTLVSSGFSFGVSPNIPMLNSAGAVVAVGTSATPVLMLDFGWGAASVTAGSAKITPGNVGGQSTIGWYQVGQWVVVDQALSATQPLIAQVVSINSDNTVTLSAPVLNAPAAGCMVGSANLMSALNAGSAVAHVPAIPAGLARMWDPQQSLTRGVAITGVAGGTGGDFIVAGFDLFGAAQTEKITHAGGATTKYGKKAFKAIVSVTPQFTDGTHAYTVGTGDTFGFVVRSDRWEATNLFWNQTFAQQAVSATGGAWTAADTTTPAANTTGDVRGTFQPSAKGVNTTAAATASNGALSGANVTGLRVAIFSSVNLYNLVAATPTNTAPMYGVTPA